MSLGQIITEATMIARLATASPDTTAVEQKAIEVVDTTKIEQVAVQKLPDYSKTANPFNIKLETGGSNLGAHPVKFQRIQLGNENFEGKYDFNGAGRDVARIKINLPDDFGFAGYMIGDFTGKDMFYWEAWKTLEVGKKSTILLDGGTGLGKGVLPEYFIIANLKNDKIFLEGAIYETGKDLTNFDKSIYGCMAYDFGHAYVGVGKNKNTLVGVTGVKGFDDVGMLTFALYDKETKGWSFISQTAVGNANKNFFTKDLFDFVVEYFSVPAFFPTHFTPQVTKGDYSLKVKGNGAGDKTELESTLGWNNEILPISLGVNTLNVEGETKAGGVIELYKPFELFGAKCYGELKYNTRSEGLTFYVGVNFNQK